MLKDSQVDEWMGFPLMMPEFDEYTRDHLIRFCRIQDNSGAFSLEEDVV